MILNVRNAEVSFIYSFHRAYTLFSLQSLSMFRKSSLMFHPKIKKEFVILRGLVILVFLFFSLSVHALPIDS